ncbi:uncharacterized protein AMSG_04193 [Thecamonas trahens ATCC 50062]|uniref:C2 domain-containing protein n=1 Tax=Thecamonas trahens ATCC 50062 TaxID=461836 RepID=A0A0L0D6I1_THETB|nr:hypothetical protein AMSG_04193 [Thecamonas trahens ATCC 50062]KNC47959.1 hypothetical protein AMSG_04193 [Thecamonas trahens ATCC 50062]|eukprot:XP_013758976.1 hypothetical protein AMSG_04193 [Thecamonas trahens ATCC 50062]
MTDTACTVIETLHMRVAEGKNLLSSSSRFGTSRSPPAAKVTVSGLGTGAVVATRTAAPSCDPFFGEELSLTLGPDTSAVFVTVSDTNSARQLGVVKIPLAGLANNTAVEAWHPLAPFQTHISGELHLRMARISPTLVRVLIMAAVGLVGSDRSGLSDPYITVRAADAATADHDIVDAAPTSLSLSALTSSIAAPAAALINRATRVASRRSRSVSVDSASSSPDIPPPDRVFSTKVVRQTLDPVFDEEFTLDLEGLDLASTRIVFQLWDFDRVGHDDFLGLVVVPLSHLDADGAVLDGWFEVRDSPQDSLLATFRPTSFTGMPSSTSLGALRLRLRYHREYILPLPDYTAFWIAVHAHDLEPLTSLADVSHDRDDLATALVKAWAAQGELYSRLPAVITNHLTKHTPDPSVIFRSNSLASKVIDMLFQLSGAHYLKSTLESAVAATYAVPAADWLAPHSAGSIWSSQPARAGLVKLLKRYLGAILDSASKLPAVCSFVLARLHDSANAVFPNLAPAIGTTAVVAFVILRFLAAAILSPSLWHLAPDLPSPHHARVFAALSKAVMRLGAFTPFDASADLAFLNPVLNAHHERTRAFLAATACYADAAPLGSQLARTRPLGSMPAINPARELNKVAEHAALCIPLLPTACRSRPWHPELLAAIDDLDARRRNELPHLTPQDAADLFAEAAAAATLASPHADADADAPPPPILSLEDIVRPRGEGAAPRRRRKRAARRRRIVAYQLDGQLVPPERLANPTHHASDLATASLLDRQIHSLEREVASDSLTLVHLKSDLPL